ncbi:MAG: TolC family protein [Burkholderiales bacterium]|nr:TolC family protein [Burkholderiales bacterium]
MQMQAQAQPTLSLDQALRLAQARSHQLVAQDAAASAAREMAAAAEQLPDPTLKAGVNNLPIDGPDRYSLTNDFMTMRSIGVMQEFTRADKRRARSVRFEREAEVAQAGRAVALADLRRDTAMAWLERCYQERMRAVLQAQRTEAGLQVEAAEAAYRGGRGSQADVFAARSAVAQIDDRIRQADGQIAAARTRLARWVGVQADEPLAPPPPLDTVALDAAHLDTELQRNPQIALMAGQQAVARAEADVARSDKHPDWSVELMYNQRGPAYSNMVSLNVSIPLQLDPKNRQDRDVAARLARVEQLRAERDEALRDRVAQARGWLQEWHSDRDRLAHFDRTLIPLAGERTRAAIAAYRGGGGPLGAVLEARRSEIDTRLDRLRLELEAAGLWARLNTLIPTEPAATAPARPADATEH